jgi:threonine 3-dehydrogenase
MRALVKAEAQPGLRLEDVPVPALGRDDVLIRVLRTGVCGTDLHIYDWDGWAQANVAVPLVVGHEFVGEVVDVALPATNVWRHGPEIASSTISKPRTPLRRQII